MNVVLLTILATATTAEVAAETCIRFLKNRNEERIFQTLPGRVWRWSREAREFVEIGAAKMNGSAACSVEMASSLRGKVIVVATDVMHPYVLREANGTDVTGFIGDAWTTLEETLGFETIYRKAGTSASQTLMNGQTHALLVATVIYSDTSGYYAYSTPITTISYAFFLRSDGAMVHREWYANAFSRNLWLTIPIFVLATTAAIVAAHRLKKAARPNRSTSDDEFSSPSFNLLVVLGSLSGQGCQRVPACWPIRLIVFSQLLTGMLLAGGFSSTLASYLAIRRSTVPLTGLEDALQKRSHSVCVRRDSSAYVRFTVDGSPNGDTRKEWKTLLNNRCPDMRNISELESHLCTPGFAYLEVPDVFLPIYRQRRGACRIVQTANRYWTLQISFIHARFASHRRLMDTRLIRLRSTGILKYLEGKWMPKGIEGTDDDRSTFQPVEYAHIHLLLLGYACAAILAALICVLENIWHALQRKQRSSSNVASHRSLGPTRAP